MILYFADRQFNILGQASTGLPNSLIVTDDKKYEDTETGVAAFDFYLNFDAKTKIKVQNFAEVGNYILRSNGDENEFYTIIEAEIDSKAQTAYIYAEDAGLDLINEVAGEFEADKEQPIKYYIDKWATDAGFEIGINEAEGLFRKLKFEAEETVTARLAAVAAGFDGCEISFSFKINGLTVAKKYINIHKKRGQDNGVKLRLNKEIDSITISKSISNLATALQCEGGTPDDAEIPITLEGYAYDDGDFYVDGTVLKSRTGLERWNRFYWKSDQSQQEGGHITRPFSCSALTQADLLAESIAELTKRREFEVNYEADIKKLPDSVKVGDRVDIIDDTGELYLSTRILKLETSVANKKKTATLGEYLLKTSGISQKVADLAAQFAKQTISVQRAQTIASNAKEIAETAKEQADIAAEEAKAVQDIANEAKDVANSAAQSATNAQAQAQAAEAAVNKVEESVTSLETTVTNAQTAADNAHQAAETAESKAEEAKTAAQNAQTEATEAKVAAGNAQTAAESAVSKADTAIGTADTAKTTAEEASATALAAKEDAEQAEKDIVAFGENLETYKKTVSAEYTRKTELTEATTSLQAQITANANELNVVHSQITVIDETANSAADLAEQAQDTAAAAQNQADKATADAEAAQTAADNAAAAATAAQNEADTAKAAAVTAQSVADKAKTDLEAAQADLATVQGRVDATEAEIAEAEKAVKDAQDAADKAQADANAATTVATNAQTVADTAVANAEAAQQAANNAADKADLAQQVADEAKGNAATAQAKADEAARTAAQAQATANTAKSNAESAQTKANEAAATATAAQQAADDADAKAAQAAADLATAQQNLADVNSRVDATEEEVAAALAAVETAQAAADKAKQDAATAQSTADTAKANAATAQHAANNAKTAADNAQKAADDAQTAADQAQADVDKLAVRVTTAETNITKTNERIDLTATKEEVTQTLGGYYTKAETDAAITTKANEINLSVDSKVAGVQVGGRNLLKNSRHIWLSSNNAALYPISFTTETENSREFRRYRRTETSLTPTTMSLYSSIPVNQITDCLTGQEITFSFLIRCSHSTTTNVMNRLVINGTNYTFATEKTFNIGTEWQRFSVTATITQEYEVNGSNILRFNPLLISIPDGVIDTFYIDVCEWKIEKGNKATDWSPAPEDIDNKFSDYSTTEQMNAALDLKAEGIFSTVSSTYTTKETFNNLDVGGRNLVLDSSMKAKTNVWVFSTDNTYNFENGYCEIYREAQSGSRTFNSQSTNNNKLLKPDTLAGGTFTLSAEIKLLDGYPAAIGSTLFYRCNTTDLSSGFQEISINFGGATADWQKVHSTFTFGDYNFDGSCQVCIALADVANTGICIRNIKLEKGNKATDWTPAPEDIDESIVASSDEIRQEIVEQNASVITTAEGIILEALTAYTKTGDFETFKEATEAAIELLSDQMTLKFTETTTKLETVNSELQEMLTTLTKFFTFDVDGFTIGQADNPYKVVIDNDRYSMFVGDNEVLWIDIISKEVHTPNLTVVDKLAALELLIDRDDAGNINCEWIE